jgi:hypothetical protein
LLPSIIEGATQFERALHQGVISHESVRPHRFHQFLFCDEAPGMLHKIFQGFVDFRAKLNLLARPENGPLGRV